MASSGLKDDDTDWASYFMCVACSDKAVAKQSWFMFMDFHLLFIKFLIYDADTVRII